MSWAACGRKWAKPKRPAERFARIGQSLHLPEQWCRAGAGDAPAVVPSAPNPSLRWPSMPHISLGVFPDWLSQERSHWYLAARQGSSQERACYEPIRRRAANEQVRQVTKGNGRSLCKGMDFISPFNGRPNQRRRGNSVPFVLTEGRGLQAVQRLRVAATPGCRHG